MPLVDRVVDSFRRHDSAELAALSVPLMVACKHELPRDLECPPDAPDGTIYSVFPQASACNGYLGQFSDVEALWKGLVNAALPFWAVAHVRDRYDIIFAAGSTFPAAKTVELSPAGISGISNTCSDPVGARYPPGTDFLVPPG